MDLSPLWFLVAATLSLMMPAGLLLIATASVAPDRAWDTALGGLAALSVAGIGYWAVGFALHFGGVGLFYPHPELGGLVWEWSALPESWGTGWGMVGLRGWFLTGPDMTPMAYVLFLAHLPWAVTAALLPMLALRGRAPALAVLFLSLAIGGFIYPIAGNWVQGGGWLAALGLNLQLGHGFVDSGGTGTVFLLTTGITLAGLLIWVPRRRNRELMDPSLPPVHLPLLAVVGALLMLTGVLGWLWSNPLQMAALGELAAMRGSVNILLFALSGGLAPLLYTWFVTGESDPAMTARGVAAGIIAGLSVSPFVAPLVAVMIGSLAGGAVPFVTFGSNRLLKLNDSAGIVVMGGLPSVLGLLAVGIFADGSVGEGWQRIGAGEYLGVAAQGVSGLLVMGGFQADFPGQLQAQMVGIVSLPLWGFAVGTLISGPLALLFHGVEVAARGREARPAPQAPQPGPPSDLVPYQPEIPAGPGRELYRGDDLPRRTNGGHADAREAYPRQRSEPPPPPRPAPPRDQ